MKRIFFFTIIFTNIFAFAQTKALTDDGKEVVLFDDGTWKFVNDSDSLSLITIKTNPTNFEKSKDATFLIKSKKFDIGLYFNPKKWEISAKTNSPFTEYLLRRTENENSLVGIMVTEKIAIPTLKSLKDVILAGLQSRVDYFRLKESEYRTVNGLKVLYLHYIANTKGLDFEYGSYYYLDEIGYCGIVSFSMQKDFENNFPKMQEFLNGITLTLKKEKVEYSSPPPPMKPQ